MVCSGQRSEALQRGEKMNNERGFTLLSMIMALGIMMIALLLATSVMSVMSHRFKDDLGLRKEISLFFIQTSRELHSSQGVKCYDSPSQMILTKDNQQISFIKSNPNRVIRQVGGQGYEIVLQNVRDIRFQSSGPFVSIQVVDMQNHSYFWQDQLYLMKEGQ
ncbi:competence protein ComGF [Sporolactobacillus sp. THM7-4]|nr:competence protein ComGF [Sporolactobacillus sp. THM7-4]